MTFGDLYPVLPEIWLACAAMALLMIGVFNPGLGLRGIGWLSIASLAGAAALVLAGPDGRIVALNGLFLSDGYADFAKILILLGASLGIVMCFGFADREGMTQFEFPILLLLSVLGMMMMVSANDLMALYLGLELQSLALYVVAAIRRDTLRSTEAGLKYFVLGALSSGMLLYGMSMIYGFAGTTGFAGLAAVLGQGDGSVSIGLLIGLVFLTAGLAFKVSAVPFHMWTPDVYEGAPTPVTAFFAAAPKIAAMALFVRVMVGPFGGMVDQWQQIIVFIALASMVFGALAAISQTNIKRLMAYSSIGHMGYALVGLAAGTEAGVTGVLVYMAIYLVMTVGTFCAILLMRQKGRMLEGIADLAGLARTHPGMAALIAVFMFSLAGIPPLAGFFGKLLVFKAAVDAGLYTLAVVGVLASVVGAYYYLRIIKLMYFDDPAESFDRPLERSLSWTMAVTGVVTLVLVVFLPSLVDTAALAAGTLFDV